MNNHLISIMVFIPLVGALLQAFLPQVGKNGLQSGRWVALAASLAASFCGAALVFAMHSSPDLQATEFYPWISSYAIGYEMGIDGLNALPVLLIAVIFPLLIAYEWNQKSGARAIHALFLLLQMSLFGAVCAQDVFLQFFFWAFSALPFYFLVGIWGGERKEKAAFQFLAASSIGNALVFAALLLIYYSIDPHTFSLKDLAGGKLAGKTFQIFGADLSVAGVSFFLISMGLALRAPIWPLHGWFNQVAEEAPFSAFVALAAATAPITLYIFIRLCCELFPDTLGAAAPVIIAVGVVNLVAGGVCAAAQRGLRLLIAFVCLGEVGYMLIGVGSLNSAGIVGAVYQQLALGLGLAGFGLLSGIIDGRAGHSRFTEPDGSRAFGGIVARAPSLAVVAAVVIATLMGFPGAGGFVGHALLIIGSYAIHPVAVVVAGIAVLLEAYYLFGMYRQVFFGKGGAVAQGFEDLTLRERAYLFPLVAGIILCGVYPKPMIDLVRPTVLTLLSSVR